LGTDPHTRDNIARIETILPLIAIRRAGITGATLVRFEGSADPMSNAVAIILGLLIVLLITADIVFLDSETLVFLGKKLFQLIEWMAFWR